MARPCPRRLAALVLAALPALAADAAPARAAAIYGTPLCVVSADAPSGMVTFVAPADSPGATIAFAFRRIAGFAPGDLVELAPAAAATDGPKVKVLAAHSEDCARYAAAAHAHH